MNYDDLYLQIILFWIKFSPDLVVLESW